MAEEPRHSAIVAAAVYGTAEAKGWVSGPLQVNLLLAMGKLRSAGGVHVDREEGVRATLELVDAVLERVGSEGDSEVKEAEVFEGVLGLAYDELVEAVGRG